MTKPLRRKGFRQGAGDHDMLEPRRPPRKLVTSATRAAATHAIADADCSVPSMTSTAPRARVRIDGSRRPAQHPRGPEQIDLRRQRSLPSARPEEEFGDVVEVVVSGDRHPPSSAKPAAVDQAGVGVGVTDATSVGVG